MKRFGFIFAFAAFAGASANSFAIETVHQGGSGDHLTIAAALAAASAAEEIRVIDGATYAESFFLGNNSLTSVPAGATITSANAVATVAVGNDGSPLVQGFTIANTGSGAAVRVQKDDAGTVTIQDCVLVQSATPLLIDIQAQPSGTVALDNIDMANCSSCLVVSGVSGGITVTADDLTIDDSTGVSVSVQDEADLTITNSSITDGSGAGIDLQVAGITLDATNATVSGSTTDAGIRIGNDGIDVDLHDCTLSGNVYGIIRAGNDADDPSTLAIDTNSDLSANRDVNLRIFEPMTIDITDSTIDGALGTAGFNEGHGVHLFNGGEQSFTATNTSFSGNDASGFYGEVGNSPDPTGATWTFARCTFVDNGDNYLWADSAQASGANLAVSRSVFRRTAGSANSNLRLDNVNATVTNSLFDHANARMLNCQTNLGGTVDVQHCTFVLSSGIAQGIAVELGGTVNVRNSILDLPGSQAYLADTGGTITDDYNNVRGTQFGVTFGANTGTGNPLFVTASSGPGTGDFNLQGTSPAAGTGDPGVGLTTDLNGNTRPFPALSDPDKGAYENASVPVGLSEFSID